MVDFFGSTIPRKSYFGQSCVSFLGLKFLGGTAANPLNLNLCQDAKISPYQTKIAFFVMQVFKVHNFYKMSKTLLKIFSKYKKKLECII